MTSALQRATLSVALPTLIAVAIAPAISGGSRALAQTSPQAAAAREAAVLSFINISSDPADDWIGTGIAESLASDLNRAGIAAARAETASVPRATEVGLGAPQAILETGRTLGASWLITGAYQRIGDRLRITARRAVGSAGPGRSATLETLQTVGRDVRRLSFDIQDRLPRSRTRGSGGGRGRAAAHTLRRAHAAPPPASAPRTKRMHGGPRAPAR